MHCVAHFDNSESNLNNPDPDATVRWEIKPGDEMMIGYFEVAMPRKRVDAEPPEVLAVMQQFDKNGDGIIQRNEVPKRHAGIFDKLDVNADDNVTLKELRRLTSLK